MPLCHFSHTEVIPTRSKMTLICTLNSFVANVSGRQEWHCKRQFYNSIIGRVCLLQSYIAL